MTPQKPTLFERAICVLVGLAAGFSLVFGVAEAAIVQPYGEPEGVREVPIPAGLEKVAEEFWAYRGVTLPPRPELIEMVPEPGIAAARGDMPGRRVWIAPEFLHGDRRYLCEIYIHERGHNAGLPHSSTYWIMESGELWRHPIAPRCAKWAWV